jgi:FtsH-binding integral membrane protein
MWSLLLLVVASAAEGDFEIYHQFSPPPQKPNPVFSYVFCCVAVVGLLAFLGLLTRLKLNSDLKKIGVMNYILFFLVIILPCAQLVLFWVGTTLLQVLPQLVLRS